MYKFKEVELPVGTSVVICCSFTHALLMFNDEVLRLINYDIEYKTDYSYLSISVNESTLVFRHELDPSLDGYSSDVLVLDFTSKVPARFNNVKRV